MNWCAKLLLILALAVGAPNLHAQDKPVKDKSEAKDKKKEKKNKQDAKDAKTNDGELSIPIPIGRDAKGIRLPYYGANGKLQMKFAIESAKRISEDQLEMTNVRLETFTETGEPEMQIDATVSILNLKTKIIVSDVPVTIKRSDFEITGDKMEFDTVNKLGKFTGNTRMLIYPKEETQPEAGAAKASEPAKSAKPDKTPEQP